MAIVQPVPAYALPFIGNEKALQELGLKFNPQWLKWFLDLINGGLAGATLHDDLAGLQGGTVGEYYHLTASQHSAVVGNKTANFVYAGPAAGAPAAPDFRALVPADVTLARGGTGANLTASNGGIFYSTATVGAILAGTAIAGQLLRSGATAAPSWSTPTFPNTAASGTFIRGDGTNWLQSVLTLPNASTSGGVLYSSAADTIATSAALGSTQVVLGGGAGAAPNTSANLTFSGSVLTLAGNILFSGNSRLITGDFTNATHVNRTLFQSSTVNGATVVGAIPNGSSPAAAYLVYNNSTPTNSNAGYFQSTGSAVSVGSIAVGAGTLLPFDFQMAGTTQLRMSTTGTLFVGGSTTATARLHIAAGTATASTAPLKFTSGNLLGTAEAGAVEFLADKFYGTITTGAARVEVTLNDAALTATRVPFATTNGRLTDDSTMTFAAAVFTAPQLKSLAAAGRVTVESSSTNPTYVQYIVSGTSGGLHGIASSANEIVIGSAAGDFGARVTSKAFRWSVDNGTTCHLTLASTALTSAVDVIVPDEAYSITGWDSDLSAPTKNAIRDLIATYYTSNTYTPTLTGVTNVAALTARACQWGRTDNQITVSGLMNVDPTAAAGTSTDVGISLPVASAFTVAEDCSGTMGAISAVEAGGIFADVANTRANLRFLAVDAANHTVAFVFTYKVI